MIPYARIAGFLHVGEVERKKKTEMEQKITIRVATPDDAPALLELYAPYVTQTAITFEYEVPTVEEFRSRIAHTLESYPYLVAEMGETLVGYVYVSTFKDRPAYDWSVETSIYVGMEYRRMAVGRKLYEELERILKQQGILNVNACIAYPRQEDEHLTMDSVHFHERLGYRMVGCFHDSGYKFGRWYDMVWMEKMIGEHLSEQPQIIPFSKLTIEKC